MSATAKSTKTNLKSFVLNFIAFGVAVVGTAIVCLNGGRMHGRAECAKFYEEERRFADPKATPKDGEYSVFDDVVECLPLNKRPAKE